MGAHLDAEGIANAQTLTDIRKTLSEIEAIDTDVIAQQIENDNRRLAYLAKQMQLIIAMQSCLEGGEAARFLDTLRAISGDCRRPWCQIAASSASPPETSQTPGPSSTCSTFTTPSSA